jgi:SOS-response transcriptional repressor LexA
MTILTRRQRQILDFLRDRPDRFAQPPTLDELCLASRGSLHKHLVMALIDQAEAILKYLEQTPDSVLLIPANACLTAQAYRPEQVEILIGQMRSYRFH